MKNHNLKANTNTAPDNNAVHEAVSFYWGERCADYKKGCPTCAAWKQYDNFANLTNVRKWGEAVKEYQEPQAHHWIALRLVKQLFKAHKGHGRNSGLSTMWLLREVGSKQLLVMIDQLHAEEGTKP